MKTLVVFYSLEGNTKTAAERIAAELGADMVRLVPQKDIPTQAPAKFFKGGFLAALGCGTKLQKLQIVKPDGTVVPEPEDYFGVKTDSEIVRSYDRVILGTPVWANRPALAVNEFLRRYADPQQIVAVFTYAGGGDNSLCMQYLGKKLPNITNTVSLADRANESLAADNEAKLTAFVQAITK